MLRTLAQVLYPHLTDHPLMLSALNSVAVTASTGIAACNIAGVTLHSFAGIGLGTESVSEVCVCV